VHDDGRALMLYRSPVTRWVLTIVGLCVGWVLIFGDHAKWRTAPSLRWVAHVPVVDLPFWGVLFIVYALALIPRRTRPAGFALGAVLVTVFAVSLIATIGSEGPKNIVAIGGLVDLAAFHLYAVKTALAADAIEGKR
jgi:hypothetical protein